MKHVRNGDRTRASIMSRCKHTHEIQQRGVAPTMDRPGRAQKHGRRRLALSRNSSEPSASTNKATLSCAWPCHGASVAEGFWGASSRLRPVLGAGRRTRFGCDASPLAIKVNVMWSRSSNDSLCLLHMPLLSNTRKPWPRLNCVNVASERDLATIHLRNTQSLMC